MVMQMLDAGGIEIMTDRVREADVDNPKGYYELERVKDLGQGGDTHWLKDGRGKGVKIISFLLRDLPRTLNYNVLFILRDIDEILASQQKMLIHRDEKGDDTSDEKMKENYANHLWRARYLIDRQPNFGVLYLNYTDVLHRPKEEALRMNDFLGGRLNTQAMTQAVDGTLHRNRREAL